MRKNEAHAASRFIYFADDIAFEELLTFDAPARGAATGAARTLVLRDRLAGTRHNGPGDHPMTAEFKSEADGKKWGQTQSKEWAKWLVEEDREVIDSYQQYGLFSAANDMLRGDDNDRSWYGSDEKIAHETIVLADTLRSNATTTPAVVYRGMGTEGLGKPFAEIKKGHIFEDKGFTSTTTSADTMETFAGNQPYLNNPPVRMKIHLPTGTKGAFLEAAVNPSFGLHEFLLPPGNQFRVMDIAEIEHPNHVTERTMTVQLIGQP